ncbi:MAG: arylesterase [Thermomicrobiales bacterium]|nr:arylesterase [Thermomicrobiales bacterium]
MAVSVVSFKAKRSFVGACAAFVLWLGCCVAGAAAEPATPTRTILVLGDSLSAGYGINLEQGWVALLQKRLAAQGYGYRVVNASVSGETTAGGLQRLPRALALHRPEIVILELGGNDGLRGLSLATTADNLGRMVQLSETAGARVLLLGMKMPPNYGPRYTQGFERIFADLASRRKLAFVPFFLEHVALKPGMIQTDGIHPTVPAQSRMLDSVWPTLQRQLLRR